MKMKMVSRKVPVQSSGLNYEQAVEEAKVIVSRVQKDLWRLAEIAFSLEPKYGDLTLARFAEEVGLSYRTIRAYRQIYEKFKDTKWQRLPFWTAAELVTVPNAEQVIEENPKITRQEARAIAKEARTLSEPIPEIPPEMLIPKGYTKETWEQQMQKNSEELERYERTGKWEIDHSVIHLRQEVDRKDFIFVLSLLHPDKLPLNGPLREEYEKACMILNGWRVAVN